VTDFADFVREWDGSYTIARQTSTVWVRPSPRAETNHRLATAQRVARQLLGCGCRRCWSGYSHATIDRSGVLGPPPVPSEAPPENPPPLTPENNVPPA